MLRELRDWVNDLPPVRHRLAIRASESAIIEAPLTVRVLEGLYL
jgi:hypothetical protein